MGLFGPVYDLYFRCQCIFIEAYPSQTGVKLRSACFPLCFDLSVTQTSSNRFPSVFSILYSGPIARTSSLQFTVVALGVPADAEETGLGVCVCEFEQYFGMGQSKVSYHLRKLKEAGLVREEKRGKSSFYSLDWEAVTELIKELTGQLGIRCVDH